MASDPTGRTSAASAASAAPAAIPSLLKTAWSPKLNSRVLAFISVVIFFMVLGNAWPVFFNEGSALIKNLEFRETLDAVDDASIEALMAEALYGEEPADTKIETRDPYENIETLRLLDRIIAILCLTLAVALPFLAAWKPPFAWAYVIPAIWILLNAIAAMDSGGKAHAELSIPAHATRFILPIALALLIWRPSKPSTAKTANWLLRIACALTFFIHGWEAFRLHPAFQDLIYTFFSLFGVTVSSDLIHVLLRCIGIMDFLLALSVLLIHSPMILRWMVFWGLMTAFMRPFTISWEAWPELAIRLANGICPWLIIAIGLPALIPRRKQAIEKTT